MTSNAGSDFKAATLGFGVSQAEGLKNKAEIALKQIFRPEFLNRINEVVVFETLTKKELDGICRLMLGDIQKALEEKNITISYTDSVVNYIIEKGFDEQYGARPMKRVIFREVENKIAELIISNAITDGDSIVVDAIDGNVTVIKK